jgi:hypothetical protein
LSTTRRRKTHAERYSVTVAPAFSRWMDSSSIPKKEAVGIGMHGSAFS